MIAALFGLQACKKSRSDMGAELYKATKNKVFKDVTPEGFAEVFKTTLSSEKAKLTQSTFITNYYETNDYDPILVMDQVLKGKVDFTTDYLSKANEHGLDPKIFQAAEIEALTKKLKNKKSIKSLDEAYKTIAELELLSANALVNYSNAMQFGLVSPRKIYARYFTATKRPDSLTMGQVLKTNDLKHYLDSIQPSGDQYKYLQKALMNNTQVAGLSPEETKRILIVNLERLRWKNKPTEDKYVIVNIPAYEVDVVENGKSVLNMKVCVGEGRNVDKENSLTEYDESDKVDRPFSRETPQLNSMIYVSQVNPVWNIPESIVNNEIVKHAQADRYYLGNNNIDVFKNGEKVEDAETLDWGSVNLKDYSFKQQPGDDNSLGKIKFLFPNKSSVYLHDTPAKRPFTQTMRAVSHGCVRLERPLDMAHALYGDGGKFEQIKKMMSEDNPEPTDVTLPKKVPVYITYITCWLEGPSIQFRPDVYGLDIVLYAHMKNLKAVI